MVRLVKWGDIVAKIQFKGKLQTVKYVDGAIAYQYIQVPELDRKHCDMQAFRVHPKFGSYANSDFVQRNVTTNTNKCIRG